MSKIDYQALREKAEKATCGEWSLEYGEGRFDGDDALIHREVVGYLPICRIEGAHPESGFDEDFQMEQQANAEFIAAANPATVLALLDERERNQQYIKRRDQENEEIALTVGKLRVELEAAKKCIAELESNCGALVAECQNKKAALEEILSHLPINHPDIDIACVANIAHNKLGEVKSTTSEAYLVEIQAQGLEAFALTMRDTGDDPFFDSVASACADAADRFAALLRKGQSCLRPNFEGKR
ncbi:ead/Ea22-like family protein [Escherichia coli]|nr:ead/Ea22-like family protein [Escherichia coli]